MLLAYMSNEIVKPKLQLFMTVAQGHIKNKNSLFGH